MTIYKKAEVGKLIESSGTNTFRKMRLDMQNKLVFILCGDARVQVSKTYLWKTINKQKISVVLAEVNEKYFMIDLLRV